MIEKLFINYRELKILEFHYNSMRILDSMKNINNANSDIKLKIDIHDDFKIDDKQLDIGNLFIIYSRRIDAKLNESQSENLINLIVSIRLGLNKVENEKFNYNIEDLKKSFMKPNKILSYLSYELSSIVSTLTLLSGDQPIVLPPKDYLKG